MSIYTDIDRREQIQRRERKKKEEINREQMSEPPLAALVGSSVCICNVNVTCIHRGRVLDFQRLLAHAGGSVVRLITSVETNLFYV